jgi:hypothetical protein
MQISRQDRRSDLVFKKVASAYLGASCFYTYLISFVAEWIAFGNADTLRRHEMASTISEVRNFGTWYAGWQIALPDLHITLSRMDGRCATEFFIVVALTSVLVSLLTYLFWNKPRRLILPAALFVLFTVLFSIAFDPAALGTILAAFCFSFLFFVARGMNEFNPHWELTVNNNLLDQTKFTEVSKLFNQYTFTAIAAVAFIVAACFFNATTLIKDALWSPADANKLYRVVQVPFLITTAMYGTWGCFWLSALIIRELQVKQHELLLMPIGKSVAPGLNHPVLVSDLRENNGS